METTKDPIVEAVISKYRERSDKGMETYGVTMEKANHSLDKWLQHLQEELMDATLYIEKVRRLLPR